MGAASLVRDPMPYGLGFSGLIHKRDEGVQRGPGGPLHIAVSPPAFSNQP